MDSSGKLLRERLPAALIQKLEAFRDDVRRIKLRETVLHSANLILGAFLICFVVDRVLDLPGWLRGGMLVLVPAGIAWLFWRYLSKTVFSTGEWTGLARLIESKFPGPGDRLLGVLEIGSDDSEWSRSRTLSQAAISQVSAELRVTDFDRALPRPRFQLLCSLCFGGAFFILLLAFLIPQPVANTALRWAAPWMDVDRYTFAQPRALEPVLHVARGEDYRIRLPLYESSPWKPSTASISLDGRDRRKVPLGDAMEYVIEVPGHSDSRNLEIRVGDWTSTLSVSPQERSSIRSAKAAVKLPSYLQIPEPLQRDVRSGTLSVVEGSTASVQLEIDRELTGVEASEFNAGIDGPLINVDLGTPQESIEGRLTWTDSFGLEGISTFSLRVNVVEDALPGIVISDLPRTRVILEDDAISFGVQVSDDFGIREVGMEWAGEGDPEQSSRPSTGEKLFASANPDQPSMQLTGTFSAVDLGIDPQPLKVRFFVRDYNPASDRVWSQEYLFYVLNEDQHWQWMTRQLSRWQQDALLVKSREEQLLRINQELRDMDAGALDDPEVRQKIRTQASAEKANGVQLARLSRSGVELIQEAARNSQFSPGTLENWAGILNVIQDISGNRMPSVEELLKQASNQPSSSGPMQNSASTGADSDNRVAQSGDSSPGQTKDPGDEASQSDKNSDEKTGPVIGQNRRGSGGPGGPQDDEGEDGETPAPKIPSIVDNESSLQPEDPNAVDENQEQDPQTASGGAAPAFGLPSTTLEDFGGAQPQSSPIEQKMEEAVTEQENLLAEFEKVSDELNRILADLEGSTFVKRLKAASRAQMQMAGILAAQVDESFGMSAQRLPRSVRTVLEELKVQDKNNLTTLDEIHQDMKAYYQRKQFTKFRNVLDDMEELDPFTGLDIKSEVMADEVGWCLSMSEYWGDTFDRWAEDLVDPASGGT